jgi:hypothetical protein
MNFSFGICLVGIIGPGNTIWIETPEMHFSPATDDLG